MENLSWTGSTLFGLGRKPVDLCGILGKILVCSETNKAAFASEFFPIEFNERDNTYR